MERSPLISAMIFLLFTVPVTAESSFRMPKVYELHGVKHVDEYFWIRGDKPEGELNDEILALIEKENEMSKAFLDTHQELLNSINSEIISNQQEEEYVLPYDTEHFIFTYEYPNDDSDYYARKATDKKTGKTYLVLDENKRAEDKTAYDVRRTSSSYNAQLYGWSEMVNNERTATIYLSELGKPDNIVLTVEQTSGEFAFSKDGDAILYVKLNDVGYPANIYRRNIKSGEEKLVFEQTNTDGYTSIRHSTSGEYLIVYTVGRDYMALDIIPLVGVGHQIYTLLPRSAKIKASLDHIDGKFFLIHKELTLNRTISSLDDSTVLKESYEFDLAQWNHLFSGRDNFIIEENANYEKGILFTVRQNGVDLLHHLSSDSGEVKQIPLSDTNGRVMLNGQKTYNKSKNLLFVDFENFFTPNTIKTIDPVTFDVKDFMVLASNDFEPNKYQAIRTEFIGRDGTAIPISILGLKTTFDSKLPAPVVLYAYGAYGEGIPPEFASHQLPLIDRGFLYVIAHVRGGNEKGSSWHEQGRLANKINSTYDYLDAAHFLIKEKYTKKGMLNAYGESASGMIVGMALNLESELFRSAGAEVPSIDITNSLMDRELPYWGEDVTEFGNPYESKEMYDNIIARSPMDNIKAQPYPPTYFNAGVDDVAVGHYEPMKWAYKVRATQTNEAPIYISIRPGGHIQTDRYGFEMSMAKTFTFFLVQNKEFLDD